VQADLCRVDGCSCVEAQLLVLKVFFVHSSVTQMKFEGIRNHCQDLGETTTKSISDDLCSASNIKCRGRRTETFFNETLVNDR